MEWLWNLDQRVLEMINRGWHSSADDALFAALTVLGLGWLQVLLFLPLLFMKRFRVCGVVCLAAWSVSGILTHIFKEMSLRLRPGNLPDTILAPDERIFMSGFPSGHTTTAFAVAVALALCWPGKRRRLVGFIAILLAIGVALSRVYRGVHWPTDVLGGAALGFACAAIAHLLLSARPKGESA
ncbi:MAG: phosphatase PAP2 family protein [Armatimonadetes bacterium]|nr:phosphatase PAP2 family protein [Armatimonadota bacterium]